VSLCCSADPESEALLFLMHAFPGRTKVVLRDALHKHNGDVRSTADALIESAPQAQAARDGHKGLDWDELARKAPVGSKRSAKHAHKVALAETAAEDRTHHVRDNAWLLSSSVQSQLALLLDVAPEYVSRTFARDFKLASAATLLIESEAEKWPLKALDEAGGAPSGTAATLADGLVGVSGCTRADAQLAFRAAKGRQDAALDLLDLMALVRAASQEAEVAPRPATLFSSTTTPAAPAPKKRPARKGAAVKPVDGRLDALDALRDGATVLPASSARVVLPAESTSRVTRTRVSDPNEPLDNAPPGAEITRSSAECRILAAQYRARRDEALRKASSAFRVGAGAKTQRLGGGGAAWHYADEARTLEAKSRMWSMRAAHKLVEERRGDEERAGELDLHLLTLPEALDVTRAELSRWRARGATGEPLRIVTGVGNHSRNNVAVLRPGIKKMLEREGWEATEQGSGSGIFLVRGLAR
jgi:hypothetical protein